MRKRSKDIVSEMIGTELVPMSFSCHQVVDEVRLIPYVYVTDLWASIEKMLDDNHR